LAWAKNDHLGFALSYVFRGVIHKYYPDFLIKLKNSKILILEVKGKDDNKTEPNNNTSSSAKEYRQKSLPGRFQRFQFVTH
jgi:hypothetical protein